MNRRLFSGYLPILIFLLAVSMFQSSCGQGSDSGNFQSNNETQLPILAEKDQEREPTSPVGRKIIKDGDISFETSDIQKEKASITQMVSTLKGYISDESIFSYGDRTEQRLIIRIPADKFDTLINQITAKASKLESKNIRVIDVTEEFIDIESRITTKKELQQRYKELLKKANTVNEMLALEKEIGQLQSDIESVEGRMKYLKDQMAMSTLSVTFYQKTSTASGFFFRLIKAFSEGWSGFLSFVIGIAHLWVFILIGIVAFYWLLKRRKKHRNP